MSIEELQSAIAQLPAEELDRFSRWFEEFQGSWARPTTPGSHPLTVIERHRVLTAAA